MSINLNEEDRAKHIIEVIKLQDYYLQIYELSKDVEIYNGVKKLDELKNFVIIMSINDSDSIRYISSESNKNIRKLLELYKKYVAIQSKSNKRNLFGESELYIQALTDPIKEMIAYIYKEEKSKWINDSIEYDNKIVSNRTIKDFKKRAALIKYMRENEMSEYPLNMEETIKLK